MRWKGGRESENVEDRRGSSRKPMLMAGGGLGTLLVVVLALAFGVDPQALFNAQPGAGPLGGAGQGNPMVDGDEQDAAPDDEATRELKQFVRVVLADTEDVWRELFLDMGEEYKDPRLVLFSRQVESACGYASAAMGPFYCPADKKVYIDLSFYQQLKDEFRAPGDFAQAYVIAHEVGHHVQNLLGISDQVHAQQSKVSEAKSNELSVRLELQADFFAGVWAHHAEASRKILEAGDVQEALDAANAIGDDRLQQESRGYVVPDSFTHGTSEQRMRWFSLGLKTGDVSQGDTFSADEL